MDQGGDTAPRPVPSARGRRCGPARDHAYRESHPRHGRRGGRGNGRLPDLPPPDRRDEGIAPIHVSVGDDRRPFCMAFELLSRRRDLAAHGWKPLPIRSVTVTSGSLCTRHALGCDTPTNPQVAGVVAVAPRPQGRSVAGGRLRPLPGATPVFGMPHTPRLRLGCARPSHPRLGSLPGQRSRARVRAGRTFRCGWRSPRNRHSGRSRPCRTGTPARRAVP